MSPTFLCLITDLALQPGLGPVFINTFLEALQASGKEAQELYSMSASALGNEYGLTQRQRTLVFNALRDQEGQISHQTLCAEKGITVVTVLDSEYPQLLKNIHVPPPVLWVKGNLPNVGMQLCSIVGSRNANAYGMRVAGQLARECTQEGIGVVSGGARGIDSAAHRAAVEQGGYTMVVAGSGLAHTYPPEHDLLFEEVVEAGGALVSPFPPDTQPSRGTFPARNRLIAGIAGACVVVQAAARSGALITAQHALEEGREVGAVPGPIDDLRSEGCHRLLKEGARVVSSLSDMFDLDQKKSRNVAADHGILAHLSLPLTFEELLGATKFSPQALMQELSNLQIAKKINQNMAGQWEKI